MSGRGHIESIETNYDEKVIHKNPKIGQTWPQATAQFTGSPTNPKEEFKMRKTKLDLLAEMLNFSLMTSCNLMTISLRRIIGGAWWVLG